MANLNIDGQHVSTSIKGLGSAHLMQMTAEYLINKKPFWLFSDNHHGLIVIPEQNTCFDIDNQQLTVCRSANELEWIIQCGMILYDMIQTYDVKKLPSMYAQKLPDSIKQIQP